MTAFQHLLRAWREAITSHTYDLVADTEAGWTDDDARRLTEFFLTTTGKKLTARLTNYVIRSAIEATRQPSNHAYHNGVARGVALSVNTMQQHFYVGSPKPESDSSQPARLSEEMALK
jgi:hypothetical protein